MTRTTSHRGATKLAALGITLAMGSAFVAVPTVLVLSSDSAAVVEDTTVGTTSGAVAASHEETHAEGTLDVLHDDGTVHVEPDHDHEHGTGAVHGGPGSVPGVEGGVVLEEVLDNTYQFVLTGATPHGFVIDAPHDPGNSRFTVLSGELPPGITLNEDGTWSGSSTEKGEYSFRVKVENLTASFFVEYRMDVVTADQLGPAEWGPEATNTKQTVAAGESLTTLTGSAPAQLVFSTFDPEIPGVTLSPNGEWFGKPSTPGTYTMVVNLSTFYNRNGVDRTLTVTVTAAKALAFSSAPTNKLQTVQRDKFFVLTDLELIGHKGGLDVTQVAGELPPGVVLGHYGELSGLATKSGTYEATVEAVNDIGQKARTDLKIVVTDDAPHLVTFSSAASNKEQTVTTGSALRALEASDTGGGTLRFELVQGRLPAGITLQPNGTFTGTTTEEGVTDATIVARLDEKHFAFTELTVVVSDVEGVPSKEEPPGVVTAPVKPPVVKPLPPTPSKPAAPKPLPVPPMKDPVKEKAEKIAPPAPKPGAALPAPGAKASSGQPAGEDSSNEAPAGNAPAGKAPAGTETPLGTDPSEWDDLGLPEAAEEDEAPKLTTFVPVADESAPVESPEVLVMVLGGMAGLLLAVGAWLWRSRKA